MLVCAYQATNQIQATLSGWAQDIPLLVELAPETTLGNRDLVREKIASLPTVTRITYHSPQDLLTELRAHSTRLEGLVENVDATSIPPLVEVYTNLQPSDQTNHQKLKEKLHEISSVESVEDSSETWRELEQLSEVVSGGGILLCIALTIALGFMVSNTIRLSMMSRQDEIHIQSLVGGTPLFIAAPYLWEAFIWSLLGSAIACMFLFGIESLHIENTALIKNYFSQEKPFQLLTVFHITLVFIFCLSLSSCGAVATIVRVLNQEMAQS